MWDGNGARCVTAELETVNKNTCQLKQSHVCADVCD